MSGFEEINGNLELLGQRSIKVMVGNGKKALKSGGDSPVALSDWPPDLEVKHRRRMTRIAETMDPMTVYMR